MSVSAIKDGSGLLVRSVVQGGAVCQDGRLGVGDVILAFNGESTCDATTAKARAMLRRHSVLGPEISITYVAAHEVDEYRALQCLPSITAVQEGTLYSTPTPPTASPEPPKMFAARTPSPDHKVSQPSSALRHSASGRGQTAAPDASTVRSAGSFTSQLQSLAVVPTIYPAPDSSWVNPQYITKGIEGQEKVLEAKEKSPLRKELDACIDGKKEDDALLSYLPVSWDQARSVHLTRAPGQSIGISIMGGRGMGRRLSSGEMMRGVFIKQISPDSPAAHNGTLQIGDRILEVSGVDLRDASHEQAVEAIRSAGHDMLFLVQSGQHASQPKMGNQAEVTQVFTTPSEKEPVSSLFNILSPTKTFTPIPFKVPSPTCDRKQHRGPATLPAPITAAAIDEETTGRKKILQRYGSLTGKLQVIELKKDPTVRDLGISLSGNKEDSKARMSVYVAAIDPQGPAGLDGRLRVGDEILEINGQILYGRSQQNASTIIKNTPSKVKIVLIRNKASLGEMAPAHTVAVKDTVYTPNKTPRAGRHASLPQDPQEKSRQEVTVGPLIQPEAHSKGRRQARDRFFADESWTRPPLDKPSSPTRQARITEKTSIPRMKKTTSVTLPPPEFTSNFISLSATLPVTPASSASLTETQPCPTGRANWPTSTSISDPRTCPVVPGRGTDIEIYKGNVGLGLSIVGGCDTLQGSVIIHEVNDGGAAQRDGRLQAGDQILEVNGIDLRQATHDEAIGVLRLTTQRVHMGIFRHHEAYREEDLWDVFTLELTADARMGLGFTTVGKSNDTGIFVSDIINGGIADLDERLLLGDQILSINGKDVRDASQDDARKLLCCSGTVCLEVARFKAGVPCPQRKQMEDSEGSSLNPSSGYDLPVDHQGETNIKAWTTVKEDYNKVRQVLMKKGPCESLGISLAGGVGSPHGNVPIFIATMDTNGLAAKTEQLQTGDRILSINDVSMKGMTHVQCGALLKTISGTVTLQVASSSSSLQHHTDVPTITSGRPCTLPCSHSTLCARMYKTIALERGSSGLGFSVVGGYGSPHGDLPIYIKTVFNKGAAVEDGRLKRGDQIIAVNGHCLEGVTHAEAVNVLKRTKGTVVLTVLS